MEKVIIEGVPESVLEKIQAGVEYAQEKNIRFIQNDWGVILNNGKWEAVPMLGNNSCCLLGACLVRENPELGVAPQTPSEVAHIVDGVAGAILGLDAVEIGEIITGFDEGDDSTAYAMLGKKWAEVLFGADIFKSDDDPDYDDENPDW